MSIVFCFVCFNLMLEDHDDFNRKKKKSLKVEEAITSGRENVTRQM